jgi:hypothetical protein
MADGTLSPNSRELEYGEVVDITELAPEGHGIAQDVEDILDANHVPSSVVDEEEPPLEQARAGTPPSPLLQNKGKGRPRMQIRPRMALEPAPCSSHVCTPQCCIGLVPWMPIYFGPAASAA